MKSGLIPAFLLLIIFCVFQTSTLYDHLPYGLRPDFLGMLVLACGALWGSRKGGLIGIIGGFLIGIQTLYFWGFRALIYCIMGMLAGMVSKRIYLENPLALGLLGIVGGLYLGIFPPVLAYLTGQTKHPEFILSDIPFSLGVNLLSLFIMYYFLKFVQGSPDKIRLKKI